MTPPTTKKPEVKSLTPGLTRQVFLWIPIIGGVVHQFVMRFFAPVPVPDEVTQAVPLIGSKFDCLPVFLDPPGYLQPAVTLGYQWWFVLLIFSAVICIMAYAERIRTFPNRLVFPFYLYLLFLLIFVKPVSHQGGETPAKCGPEVEETPPAASVIIWDHSISSG